MTRKKQRTQEPLHDRMESLNTLLAEGDSHAAGMGGYDAAVPVDEPDPSFYGQGGHEDDVAQDEPSGPLGTGQDPGPSNKSVTRPSRTGFQQPRLSGTAGVSKPRVSSRPRKSKNRVS